MTRNLLNAEFTRADSMAHRWRLAGSIFLPVTSDSCSTTCLSTPMVSPMRRGILIMAARPPRLAFTQQTPSLRYGMAPFSQTEHNCLICGKPVDMNTSKEDAASKAMHEGCYVLRQMLIQSTTLTSRPRA